MIFQIIVIFYVTFFVNYLKSLTKTLQSSLTFLQMKGGEFDKITILAASFALKYNQIGARVKRSTCATTSSICYDRMRSLVSLQLRDIADSLKLKENEISEKRKIIFLDLEFSISATKILTSSWELGLRINEEKKEVTKDRKPDELGDSGLVKMNFLARVSHDNVNYLVWFKYLKDDLEYQELKKSNAGE